MRAAEELNASQRQYNYRCLSDIDGLPIVTLAFSLIIEEVCASSVGFWKAHSRYFGGTLTIRLITRWISLKCDLRFCSKRSFRSLFSRRLEGWPGSKLRRLLEASRSLIPGNADSKVGVFVRCGAPSDE
jgi:hypothetical protein